MLSIVVLTGAGGAGKTSVTAEVSRRGAAKLLKPFTTRAPRSAAEDEYHFVPRTPAPAATAWKVRHGTFSYGMLHSELASAHLDAVAITVFDPQQLAVLESFRRTRKDIEVTIVGLDTIETEVEQHRRVGGDPKRTESQAEIDSTRRALGKVDIILHGSERKVTEAVEAICWILGSRGGIVPKEYLEPLLGAGTLLNNSDVTNLESASYDLRVGDEVWCGGSFTDLNAQDPYFTVPPYSYAIVKAHESAAIPPFLIAQFDLKVSHFLSGMILSNGPQVDPGYRGDLFCMLFNGSSVGRPLRQGDHFSTIHFITTVKSGEPYGGQYRLRDRLRNNMPPEAATGPGGAIFTRIALEIESAKSELTSKIPKERSGLYLGLFALVAAICLAIAGWAVMAAQDATKAANEARGLIEKLNNASPGSATAKLEGAAEPSQAAATPSGEGSNVTVGLPPKPQDPN